jgi:hypothetical protein
MSAIGFRMGAFLAITRGAGGGDGDGLSNGMLGGGFDGREVGVTLVVFARRATGTRGGSRFCKDGDGVGEIEQDVKTDSQDRSRPHTP